MVTQQMAPSQVQSLTRTISIDLSLASRMMRGDGTPPEVRRLFVGEGQTVRLQAFGLHSRLGIQGSRVVITMQRLTHPS